jgi:hypothetical protein
MFHLLRLKTNITTDKPEITRNLKTSKIVWSVGSGAVSTILQIVIPNRVSERAFSSARE